MGDIDYTKAEKNLEEILRKDLIKKLQEGKTVTSGRAADYYGLSEETARPSPEEPVERLIREMAAQDESLAETPQEEEESPEAVSSTPTEDIVSPTKKQSARAPKRQVLPPESVLPSEKYLEPTAPLLVLRKHILWFKRNHLDDRYERLGTTKEEVFSFRRATRLTPAQTQRIIELNHKAEKLKAELLKLTKVESDESLVEKEKRRHKTKRFNVRETWLQL